MKGLRRQVSTGSLGLIVTALLLLSLVLSSVFADRGMISIMMPNVVVFEPGQKAIIAWNGQEEILILSTDVKANQSTLILELLPLPSNPKTVERADFDSFIKLQQVIWNPILRHVESESLFEYIEQDNLQKTVVVTFHEKIGTHNITVVRAENASELAIWINDFLRSNSVPNELSIEEYASLFEDYISRGFPYFALDLVEVSPEEKSIEPILYRFETSFLYYPLKISTLFSGNTKIKLFILTQEAPDFLYYNRMVNPPWAASLVYVDENRTKAYAPANFTWSLGEVYHYNLTDDKLREIDLRLASLFNGSAHLTILDYSGALDIFTGDLILREGEALVVYPFVPALPLGLVLYPLEKSDLKIVPSTLITNKTLEEVKVTPSSHESLILTDFYTPNIYAVSYLILIDGSISFRCQVEDLMSGVDTVTLFYQVKDEEWKTDKMREIDGKFVATIPMEQYENLNFYIEASDLAGNRAVEDNEAAYYMMDATLYMFTLILRNIGLMAACILMAGLIAFIAKNFLEKRNKLGV